MGGQRCGPAALPPGMTGAHDIGGRAVMDRCGKSHPPRGYLYRLGYPGPLTRQDKELKSEADFRTINRITGITRYKFHKVLSRNLLQNIFSMVVHLGHHNVLRSKVYRTLTVQYLCTKFPQHMSTYRGADKSLARLE